MAMLKVDEVRDIAACLAEHRTTDGPFDLIIGGETPGDDVARADAIDAPYAEAGVTWWQEMLHDFRGPLTAMRARTAQGPPPVPALAHSPTRKVR